MVMHDSKECHGTPHKKKHHSFVLTKFFDTSQASCCVPQTAVQGKIQFHKLLQLADPCTLGHKESTKREDLL